MSETWKQWEGRSVDNRFPLRQFLGASNHSAVFLTESVERGGIKAAIKLVAANGAAAEAQIARWREIARLSHPNLLPLYQYGRTRLGDQELVFAVMELADETLAEILPNRPLSAQETKQMLQPVIEALTFLHERGLVHGDIQPSNILAVGETIKLSTDTVRPVQGLSAGQGARSEPDPRVAATGSTEPSGDIYSLGVTLTQALTQRSPFDSGTALGHAAEPLASPFDDIVLHALHPDPQLRWTAPDIALRLNPPTVVSIAAQQVASPPQKVRASAPESPAAAQKARAKKRPDAKPAGNAPEGLRKAQNIEPTSVPLSPVAPLPPKPPGLGSLLRYAAVIGVAALLVLALARGLRHSGNADQASAALAEKRETQAAPSTTAPRALEDKTAQPPKGNSESPAAPSSAAVTAPKPVSDASNNVEVKSAASEPQPALAAVKSELKEAETRGAEDPDVVQEVLPEISQKALSTIQGKVRLTVRVQADSNGRVNDAELIRPSGSSFFNDAALTAARKWEFQPGNATGTARSYLLQFEFTQAGAKATASRTE